MLDAVPEEYKYAGKNETTRVECIQCVRRIGVDYNDPVDSVRNRIFVDRRTVPILWNRGRAHLFDVYGQRRSVQKVFASEQLVGLW